MLYYCKTFYDAVNLHQKKTPYTYAVFLPEQKLGTLELLEHRPDITKTIITCSPFLVPCYRSVNVKIVDKDGTYTPNFETYGCSLELLVERLTAMRSTLPRSVIDAIRQNKTCDFVQTLGDSSVKAYMLKVLEKDSCHPHI